MEDLHVLLCCGAGISSGLLAQQSRKYIRKNGLKITVEAKGESQVSSYLDKINILFLGPHYESALQDFIEMASPYHVKVAVISADIYKRADGKRLVEFAQELMAN